MTQEALVFQSICDGSSKCKLDDLIVYVKHPMMNQQAIYKEVYDHWFEQYKSRGAPTNEEADQIAIDSGAWKKEDDLILSTLSEEIERLKLTAKCEKYPARIMNINRQIGKAKDLYENKLKQKLSLRTVTAEMGANLKLNDFVVVTSFFCDPTCNQRKFSDEDYQEMERNFIDKLASHYSKSMEIVCEKSIQELTLSDFFSPMFSLYDGPKGFFDKPLVNLTRPQITMCFYTKVFKSIFENIPKIPKNITKDPEALLEYAENYSPSSDSSGRKSTPARDAEVGGSFKVGATREDMEALRADGETIGNIFEETRKASKDGGNSARLMDILNL